MQTEGRRGDRGTDPMLFSARQLPRYDLAIHAPGAAPLYLQDTPAVGGAERQMMMLARALAGRGLRVCHIVEYLPGLPPSRDGVGLVVQRPRSPSGRPSVPVLTLESLRRADASVYVQRSAGLVTGVVALYARLRRRRFIYSTSSPLDLLAELDLPARDARFLRLGLRLANEIVVQTREQWEAANRFRHVVRIPSFCETPQTSEVERDTLLWVGRPASYKNPLAFIELARSVPEASFTMVGLPLAGERADAQPLYAAAEGLTNLTILPPLAHSDLLPLYERAVAVVNTSDFEGFPNAFMEGWARGALALSLRVDPDQVIVSHGLGAVAHGSASVLADVVRDAWRRRGEPDHRRAAAAAYVRRHHSPQAVGEQWYRLVNSLLGSGAPVARPRGPAVPSAFSSDNSCEP